MTEERAFRNAQSKKAYQSPTFHYYGSVSELTGGGSEMMEGMGDPAQQVNKKP